MQEEGTYICDACDEEIVVPLDFSAGDQQDYGEDCPVCCRPNVIHLEVEDDGNLRGGQRQNDGQRRSPGIADQ